ncbi:hypothetical protein JXA80_08555, partial [bacterium]|nr:hypothetical protein [candidate division CSSED10-310 bacterium]
PGPETDPGAFARIEPECPGGWRWLNARTLQFTPSKPWPAYTTITVTLDRTAVELQTVISAPVRTLPEPGSDDVMPVETVQVTFPYPVDIDALAKQTELHMWDVSATDGPPRRVLTHRDFTIKPFPSDDMNGNFTIAIMLNEAIPHGTRVHMRIALTDPPVEEACFTLDFTTSRSFSVVAAGAGSVWLPLGFDSPAVGIEPLTLSVNPPMLQIRLSSVPRPVSSVALWDFVHIAPDVPNMAFRMNDRIIAISGSFEPNTVYRATIRPTPLMEDHRGRALTLNEPVSFPFVFQKPETVLQWDRTMAVVERYGPKTLPLMGRGHQAAELRIYRIDPLDVTLWPFPDDRVRTEPAQQPPRQSENRDFHEQTRFEDTWELQRALRTLGSPLVSDLVDLPFDAMGASRVYGLDVAPFLEQVEGRDAPGSYLAAIQPADSAGERQWMRFQVTDLSLTTVEEADRLTFYVSSLSSARPVANATVTVEGFRAGDWERMLSGKTDAMGVFTWQQKETGGYSQPRRIRVERGTDQLILDAFHPPAVFRNGYWDEAGDWLFMQFNYPDLTYRSTDTGHVFTERPVYRPGDPVRIRGWIRTRQSGAFDIAQGTASITVTHAGGKEWVFSSELSPLGGFFIHFDILDGPAGVYDVRVVHGDRLVAETSFRKEDYRIPRFEVSLHGDDTVPLDEPFDVRLTSMYYAGGNMVGRSVDWQVMQHPEAWQFKGLPGFRFADDDAFSGRPSLQDKAVVMERMETDATGGSLITIDPLADPSLQTRLYVVEATVTDVDNQTVTAVKSIRALPPFLLGMKTDRLLEPGSGMRAEIVVVNPGGNLLNGHDVSVRLIRRTWHSVLKAGNYRAGEIKYDTQIVETPIMTQDVVSGPIPVTVTFPVDTAGVYIVEASVRDRLGRAQIVAMDVFVRGDDPVTWERPADRMFTAKVEKDGYMPGEIARILLESPFQVAEAVAVIESPDRTHLIHTAVRNGAGVVTVPVSRDWCPGVPVNVLLMRGRLDVPSLDPASGLDLGKPQTLGASVLLPVSKDPYRVTIDLSHPEKALPGETIDVSLRLTDDAHRPVSGEAAVWLVDRAVLALGRETRLDPLDDFLKRWPGMASMRDTREFVTGRLPWVEVPGGGFGEEFHAVLSVFDRLTLRKRFEPVPFYEPFVEIGADGRATVRVELPDNLTQYAVRVKAASGRDRFGFASGRLAVRLPVVIQPTLPRFVRPGDVFDATGVSRIVEGDAAEGRVAIQVEGLDLEDPSEKTVLWKRDVPLVSRFSLTTPDNRFDHTGRPIYDRVTVRLAAERLTDGVGDAVETIIPRVEEPRWWTETGGVTLALNEVQRIDAVDSVRFRNGSRSRQIWVSSQPLLTTALEAASMLRAYPFTCTEQKTSQAAGFLMMESLASDLQLQSFKGTFSGNIQQIIDGYTGVMTPEGLASFWPGGRGYVHLTARVVRFLADARLAGLDVDPVVLEQMTQALRKALRSDNPHLLMGWENAERVMALEALYTAGFQETAYLEEMTRRLSGLGVIDRARIIRLLAVYGQLTPARLTELAGELADAVIIESLDGRSMATGLRRDPGVGWAEPLLQTDVIGLSEILLTMLAATPADPRIPAMADGLAVLAADRVLTTYHAESLLRVTRAMLTSQGLPGLHSTLVVNGESHEIKENAPLLTMTDSGDESIDIQLIDGTPVTVRWESRAIPASPAMDLPAEANGFAVQRSGYRVDKSGSGGLRWDLDEPGKTVHLTGGDVVEEHIQVVNPSDRTYVAIRVPLAAGMEPLNPALETSPPEAIPAETITLSPDYMEFRDDHVAYYYNELPQGTYHFYFRSRAACTGRFTQPGAVVVMMYDLGSTGASAGATIEIAPAE